VDRGVLAPGRCPLDHVSSSEKAASAVIEMCSSAQASNTVRPVAPKNESEVPVERWGKTNRASPFGEKRTRPLEPSGADCVVTGAGGRITKNIRLTRI